MADPYAVLGVPRDASQSAVRAAYKRAVLACHPDKVDAGSSAFESVKDAYEAITRHRRAPTGYVDAMYNGSVSGMYDAPVADWDGGAPQGTPQGTPHSAMQSTLQGTPVEVDLASI